VLRDYVVAWEGGRITQVAPRSGRLPPADVRVELGDEVLMPGFIDLQVNGGGGVLFNDSPEASTIDQIGAAHRRYGTVGFLPTLISDEFATMRRASEAVEQAIGGGVPGVLGIHFEGPFLNPARSGAHEKSVLRPLTDAALEIIASHNAGVVVVTLAPEVNDATLIRRLARCGVILCAGHSDADYDQAKRGIDLGIRGFTHLFNAMPPLAHRAPGLVGAALADDRAWCGMIADGHHLHPAVVKIATRAKNPGGALLVTDAMPCVGARLESFRLGDRTIRVQGGKCVGIDGGLAGANLDMMSAVGNAAEFAGIDWYEAARMASLYPAKALGLAHELGRIAPGFRASLIAVAGGRRVTRVWIDGVAQPAPAPTPETPPMPPAHRGGPQRSACR